MLWFIKVVYYSVEMPYGKVVASTVSIRLVAGSGVPSSGFISRDHQLGGSILQADGGRGVG
jgi:hypothetical protein